MLRKISNIAAGPWGAGLKGLVVVGSASALALATPVLGPLGVLACGLAPAWVSSSVEFAASHSDVEEKMRKVLNEHMVPVYEKLSQILNMLTFVRDVIVFAVAYFAIRELSGILLGLLSGSPPWAIVVALGIAGVLIYFSIDRKRAERRIRRWPNMEGLYTRAYITEEKI